MRTVINSPSHSPSISSEDTAPSSLPAKRPASTTSAEDLYDTLMRPNVGLAPTAKKVELDEGAIDKMILAKGEHWNDDETRKALLRAGLSGRLVEAMHAVPAQKQEAARTALAKDAVAFFCDHNGLEADIGNAFLRENKELLWTLFASKKEFMYDTVHAGILELDAPAGFEEQIQRALVIADSFATLDALDNLGKLD